MNKYMKVAKELSEENLKTNIGGPFGACVVKNGEIIGKGSNHVLRDNDYIKKLTDNIEDNKMLNLECIDRE